ncbi:hypothetical protein VTI28DRAFT_10468 [Corynascus sepedonium]
MRNKLQSLACAVPFTLLLSWTVDAARPCSSPDGARFEYPLGDVRYDGPDPSKEDGLATFAASLQSSFGTPLYECVLQWPEAWAGWYEGGSRLIWGECIFTGAGSGLDNTVSSAFNWNSTTMYLAHTFTCSDAEGLEGLALGSIELNLNCTTTDEGSSYCVPESTSSGTRPELNIATTPIPSNPGNATSPCADTSGKYWSWSVEDWFRQYKMEPGATPTDPNAIHADTGPSFTLRSWTTGNTFDCSPSAPHDGIFVGPCSSSRNETTTTTASFVFNSRLNTLLISERWTCDDGSSSSEASGILYMQAACNREFNSDDFTCTSGPVWLGTEGV